MIIILHTGTHCTELLIPTTHTFTGLHQKHTRKYDAHGHMAPHTEKHDNVLARTHKRIEQGGEELKWSKNALHRKHSADGIRGSKCTNE